MAIGAGIFWACQKEETTEKSSITSNSNKIQKLPVGKTYVVDMYTEINGKCYHITGELFEWQDVNDYKYAITDGLYYTEVDCNSWLIGTESPITFRYELDPNAPQAVCQDDYRNQDLYIIEVVEGNPLPEELLMMFNRVTEYYYDVLIYN